MCFSFDRFMWEASGSFLGRFFDCSVFLPVAVNALNAHFETYEQHAQHSSENLTARKLRGPSSSIRHPNHRAIRSSKINFRRENANVDLFALSSGINRPWVH